jgi:hypothetical protein
MSMVPLAPEPSPATVARIVEELRPEMLLCRFRALELYVFAAAEAPTVMAEIGRIREREYRAVGAGRNLPVDIDAFDTEPPAYKQIIAWDPEEREIVAMYRFLAGCERTAGAEGAEGAAVAGRTTRAGAILRTETLFAFSPRFEREVLPVAVELGRSVVNRHARRAILGLFAVWAGLGAIIVESPGIEYFFGNVSIYPTWPVDAVELLVAFFSVWHHPNDAHGDVLARRESAGSSPGAAAYRALFAGMPRAEGWEALTSRLRVLDRAPPPILLSYMKATDGLIVYDTAVDDDFGGAWEMAIAVPTGRLTRRTVDRIITGYRPVNAGAIRRFLPV